MIGISAVLTLIGIFACFSEKIENMGIFFAVFVIMSIAIGIILHEDKKRENKLEWYFHRLSILKSVIENDIFSLKSLEKKQEEMCIRDRYSTR